MAGTTTRKAPRKKPARAKKARAKSSRDKVRAHRNKLRKLGLRPIQIWVPDTRSEEFTREAHRQSLAAARSQHAKEDQAFVDAISEWPNID